MRKSVDIKLLGGGWLRLAGLLRFALLAMCVGIAALAMPSLVSPAIASGAEAPEFEGHLEESVTYAARAHVTVIVVTHELQLTWRSEYITVTAFKEAEKNKEEAKWTVAGEGKTEGGGVGGKFAPTELLFLGMAPGSHQVQDAIVHGLVPSTAYYVRFFAENSAKENAYSSLFSIETLAAALPEIVPPGATHSIPGSEIVVSLLAPTVVGFRSQVESNGPKTEYEWSYAPAENGAAPPEGSGSWKPVTSGAKGVIEVNSFAVVEAQVSGLSSETAYYVRLKAKNGKGEAVELLSFSTPTARPSVFVEEVRNVTGESARVLGSVVPRGLETHWRFEYATSLGGTWSVAAGAEGVVSQGQAEALPEGFSTPVEGSIAGLRPSTVYYVRLFAESSEGEGRNGLGEPILSEKQDFASFTTFGAPVVRTFAVHGIHDGSLRIMGSVNPSSVPTSGEQVIEVGGGATGGTFTLSFDGETTAPIAFGAPSQGPGSVGSALQALASIGSGVSVTGPEGGPYTVYFSGRLGETSEPQITADSSGLTPSGTVTVVTVFRGGEGYESQYHFEYVSQKQYEERGGEERGWAKPVSTADVSIGSGDVAKDFGVDLEGLQAGETYRYRIVASNTSPGDPVVYGEEAFLTVPSAGGIGVEAGGGCPNEAVRTGSSARLRDCRAYEQVTPVDKGGTQEIFAYGGNFGREGALPGEDGDHVEYGSVGVKFGSGPDSGQSPYFFSRTDNGWETVAGTAQPEAGLFHYTPQLFSTDFGLFAFESNYDTSPGHASPVTNFGVGPPGGPYLTVASVPTVAVESAPHGFAGWVAGSKDFSTLILQVPDHALLGHSTHTMEGSDLYEYSNGALRQVNVTGPAPEHTIGSCGAIIAGSTRLAYEYNRRNIANSHVVSGNGSSVFFEAVPGSDCSEASHLYVRVGSGGSHPETVDVGDYHFVAAASDGSVALLEKQSGEGVENSGLYLYKLGGTPELLKDTEVVAGSNLIVSEDLSTVYIVSGQVQSPTLYRYSIASEQLVFVSHLTVYSERNFYQTSGDGRYFYFIASSMAGLPSGGLELETLHASIKGQTSQVFRYDADEGVVSCLSCSSSFDFEPRLSALFTEGGTRAASENSGYVFFDSPAALVSSDVDGQIAPEGLHNVDGGEHTSSNYSLSSDVYEWRGLGVGGCSELQGCLSLVTSGHGGFLNELLGTTPSGDDVFFSTNESLLQSDNDTADDIYDARVNGGFAESVRPVECAGDACSTPYAAPGYVASGSESFQGSGNKGVTVSEAKGKAKPKKKAKKKKKVKCKAKAKKKCKVVKKHGKNAVRRSGAAGRAGRARRR